MDSTPVGYMKRTRGHYSAQGYEKAYRWANFETVPFSQLKKPLAQSVVGLITTAMPIIEKQHGPKKVRLGSMRNPPDKFFTDDLAWDKNATHMDDLDSFLPIHHLQDLEKEGRIGQSSNHFYCVPTEYSQRRTNEVDAPEILRLCQADGVDVVLLLPL